MARVSSMLGDGELRSRGAKLVAQWVDAADDRVQWQMYAFPWKEGSDPAWRQFYLRRYGRRFGARVKQAFWIGWNGARLANSRDGAVLEKRFPEVAAVVRHELASLVLDTGADEAIPDWAL